MNIRRFSFAFLPAVILAFISCMNVNNSSGKNGAIRVSLPGSSSRGYITLSKDNAIYTVSLTQDNEQVKEPQAGFAGGGDIAFDELEPGTYTVEVTARQPDGAFLSKGSQKVKVKASETASCSITLILAGNKGKVFSSNYYILTNSSEHAEFVSPADLESISISSSATRLGAEDIEGNQFTVNASSGSQKFNFALFREDGEKTNINIDKASLKAITDYLYYDTINDSIWLGAYSSNGFYFINEVNKISTDTNYSNPCTLSGLSIYPNAQYTAFAASGTELYIAYTNNGTSYLQRAKIEGQNDSFTITAIGNPQSTQDMGIDGQITDIVIHYDGYVYVLVSQNGEKYATDAYLTSETTKAIYSRGAILRLYSTSNGFKVSAKTGWTEDKSKRTISTKGEASSSLKNSSTSNKNAIEFLDNFKNGLDLYIPNYSERNSHFYGPRRFVAIKPKELAIADSGANLMLPDYDKQKTGGFFKHNRVVNVDLYKFAIDPSSVVELNSNIISFVAASINTTIGFSTDSYTGAKEEDE